MKAANSFRTEARLSVAPDSSIEDLAYGAWGDLLASEQGKTRFTNRLAEAVGPWWHVSWELECLIVQQHLVAPAGAAFRTQTPSGRILASPKVICDGECIRSDEEPTDSGLTDDVAYLMAKTVKYLSWPRVKLRGSAQFQDSFRRYALHEADFYSWAVENARILREQRPSGIDWESIAEELEDLGISQKKALESRLRVLLAHLLKWIYEPSRRNKSWRLSIENARDEVREILEENPGLHEKIPSLLGSAYRKARRDAASETALDEDAFPPSVLWSYEQVVDDDFWPSAENDSH